MMKSIYWSISALTLSASLCPLALAGQAESKGFVEGSSLTLLNRN